MAQAARGNGDGPMIAVDKELIPQEILKDSVLVHLAEAYFSVAKRLEQKTHVRRRAVSLCPHSAAALRVIRIKSPRRLVSTGRWCTALSKRWFTRDCFQKRKPHRTERCWCGLRPKAY